MEYLLEWKIAYFNSRTKTATYRVQETIIAIINNVNVSDRILCPVLGPVL